MVQKHTIDRLYDKNSQILILGSFPSVKSREQGFFYCHPQNRFWKVLSAIFNESLPAAIDDKKSFLIRNKIALWDVIASCDITGSSDSSIKNVVPNDINLILNNCNIKKIFTNGKTAYNLYNKYLLGITGKEAIYLPSTSPANACYSIEKLTNSWKIIKL